MIRTDQTPRFGTHVIHGLTVKLNHHRVKLYHLQAFYLASFPIQAKEKMLFLPLPHTPEVRTHRERYTQSYVLIPVLASILINTVGLVIGGSLDEQFHAIVNLVWTFFSNQNKKTLSKLSVNCHWPTGGPICHCMFKTIISYT